jgi:hypothetical protein
LIQRPQKIPFGGELIALVEQLDRQAAPATGISSPVRGFCTSAIKIAPECVEYE